MTGVCPRPLTAGVATYSCEVQKYTGLLLDCFLYSRIVDSVVHDLASDDRLKYFGRLNLVLRNLEQIVLKDALVRLLVVLDVAAARVEIE